MGISTGAVHQSDGFTLVEMMITIVVVALLLSAGLPALSEMMRNNQMLAEVYGLRAALNNARSEALTRRSFVTFCRSNNGTSCSGTWADGYIAFTDDDGDGTVDTADGDAVFSARIQDLEIDSVAFSGGGNRVRFDSRGNARGFNGTFTFCDERGAEFARGLILSAVGSISAAVDSAAVDDPSDDIVNDHNGDDLACGS